MQRPVPAGARRYHLSCDGDAAATPPVPPPGASGTFAAVVDSCRPALAAAAPGAPRPPTSLMLEGRRGAGRRTLVQAAASLLGAHVVEVRLCFN